ncbi:MAG: glutathione S-transferase [Pseudomonadota bacterium]
MYVVHGDPRNRTQRVLWMLEELERDYTIRLTKARSDEARAINPSGKVPVLMDGAAAIPDSIAACQYLADKHSALTFAAGTTERGSQDAMTQFVSAEIDAALWALAKHKFALPAEHRLEGMRETFGFELALGLERLTAYLGDKTYLTGDTFTVPDLILGHCLSWATAVKAEIPEGPMSEYAKRVLSRPALARARDKGEAAKASAPDA